MERLMAMTHDEPVGFIGSIDLVLARRNPCKQSREHAAALREFYLDRVR
jgi:hypothetical protein